MSSNDPLRPSANPDPVEPLARPLLLATDGDGMSIPETLVPPTVQRPSEGVATPSIPASDQSAALTLPGYEILGELGHGGMGVVYKARDGLKRIVALKLIKQQTDGETARMLFRQEAEAVAELQHPNIVQVHEWGEYAGQPYFSLEFCGGGSLDRRLGGKPMPEREATKLLETLARAVHYAHQRLIIHRDLKPANVFLMEDGTPKVADFGLAKRLDASGQAETQSIKGTPSYMAPEQAEGRKRLGAACDIYALGAVLYDCLTGQPPFKGETLHDTLMQVIHKEPRRPSERVPKLSRDVETICLKCLQKDPGKRYASADALAEDLRRFQAGEPIEARPVGRLERAAMLVRRNPVVVSLAATVAVVLIVGATVSIALALRAEENAELATTNERKANTNAKLVEAKADELELALARSLLRPLAVNLREDAPLTDPEIDSLWELAGKQGLGVGYRFVKEASGGEVTSRQLRLRAGVALHAAVGLDVDKRDKVERLLAKRLRDPRMEKHRVELAWVTLELGMLSSETTREVAERFTQAMTTTTDDDVLRPLAEGLSAVVGRLAPQDTAPFCLDAAASLTQAMRNNPDAYALGLLAKGCSAVAAHLSPKDAKLFCETAAGCLTQTMSKTRKSNALLALAEGLSAVAPRLDPKDAAVSFIQAMTENTDADPLRVLAEGLSAVSTRLDPKDAAAFLTQAMTNSLRQIKTRTISSSILIPLGEALSAVAARRDSKGAVEAAVFLTQTMTKTTDQYALYALAKTLSAVAARLDPRDAKRFCAPAAAALIKAMNETAGHHDLHALAEGLSAVAARLDPTDAREICYAAVIFLTQSMIKTTVSEELDALAQGFSVVAPYVDPKDAARSLTDAITKTQASYALRTLAAVLWTMAARLDPKDAAAVLTQAMTKMANSDALSLLAETLSAVVARLDPADAKLFSEAAAASLSQAMSNDTKNVYALSRLAQGLSAVTTHLDPEKAKQICATAADSLTQTMTNSTETTGFTGSFALGPLAEGLSAVTAHLDPQDAVASLTKAMTKTADPDALRELAKGLSAAAVRLDPKVAAACLIQAMTKPTDPNALGPLAEGLSAVAARLDPKEAKKCCAAAASLVMQVMTKTADPHALHSLAKGLSAVAAHLDRKDAREFSADGIALLMRVRTKAEVKYDQVVHARSLSALAAPLDPKEAIASLTQAMTKTTDSNALKVLRNGLWKCLAGSAPSELSFHPTATVGLASFSTGFFLAPALLSPVVSPPECRLSTNDLVEFLKNPLCVGQARRVILDQLANRYQRKFADQWDFVRYATQENLGLDFTTPPVRRNLLADKK